jgi:hypothetical protein
MELVVGVIYIVKIEYHPKFQVPLAYYNSHHTGSHGHHVSITSSSDTGRKGGQERGEGRRGGRRGEREKVCAHACECVNICVCGLQGTSSQWLSAHE